MTDPTPQTPPGFITVAVKNLGPLLDALDRADRKGYMPDAIAAEWAAFELAALPSSTPDEADAILRELVAATNEYDAIPCPNWHTHDLEIAKAQETARAVKFDRKKDAWSRARSYCEAAAPVLSAMPKASDPLDIVQTIALGLDRGYTPAELLDENSPIRDRIRLVARAIPPAPTETP